MSSPSNLALTFLGLVALHLMFGAQGSAALAAGAAEKPYRLETIEGSSLKRVVLTPKAAQRLDIKTGQISKDASGKLIAPFRALYYDMTGQAWVYTSPEALSFVRHKVSVERVEGDNVFLIDGPPDGTRVVTVGAAELYGTERGIGH